MKILVNATNLVVGGGVQVATSFIVEAARRAEADIKRGVSVFESYACSEERLLKE